MYTAPLISGLYIRLGSYLFDLMHLIRQADFNECCLTSWYGRVLSSDHCLGTLEIIWTGEWALDMYSDPLDVYRICPPIKQLCRQQVLQLLWISMSDLQGSWSHIFTKSWRRNAHQRKHIEVDTPLQLAFLKTKSSPKRFSWLSTSFVRVDP